MARSRFCRVCKSFHDVEQAWPVECAGHFATPSAGAGEARFYVISDTMDAVRNMADGKLYDSKSRYREAVHAKGCRIVGNDRLDRSTTPLPSARDDIRRAIAQLS